MQPFLSSEEAAQLLGVSSQRVRALVAQGDLEAYKSGGRWLIPRNSLERWLSLARGIAGRPFSPANAWAAIFSISGIPPNWIPDSQEKKLLAQLIDSPDSIAAKLRRRAFRMDFRAHPSQLDSLANDRRLILSGGRAGSLYGLDLGGGSEVDGYAAISDTRGLRSEYALVDVEPTNVVLRVLDDFWPFAPDFQVAPRAAVALDLMESDDERERRAGEMLLGDFVGRQ